MKSFIEPLNKTSTSIQFGWNPEAPTGVASYNVYVGQIPTALNPVPLISGIGPRVSNEPGSFKKVTCDVSIDSVRNLLGIPAVFDFSTLVLYFAITYVDSYGSESLLSNSTVVEVPPVGIYGKTMKEDPTQNRHMFGFSDEIQRWIKVAATGKGALIMDTNSYYSSNMVTEYTRDSSGNILTEKSYFSDRTTAGSPAKLTTYSYSSGFVSKTVVVDSTVQGPFCNNLLIHVLLIIKVPFTKKINPL